MVTASEQGVGPTGVRKKTRGRGLRTTTGCITCRRRHLKCDETKPKCQQCTRNHKECLYPDSVSEAPSEEVVSLRENSIRTTTGSETLSDNAVHDAPPTSQDPQHVLDPVLPTSGVSNEYYANNFTSPNSVGTASVDQPIGVATARWFDMLAEDANIELGNVPIIEATERGIGTEAVSDNTSDAHSQFRQLHYRSDDPGALLPTPGYTTDTSISQQTSSLTTFPWQSPVALSLKQHEQTAFASFVTHISQWIDLFDPYRHFAALVPKLALHNVGLINAILALSIRHNSLSVYRQGAQPVYAREDALQYYHETLHYVSTAMQYTSYHTSLELLATTLIVSAYEMLDGSSRDWERHLQGVFWIQKSQVIHGDSGGLRGAVWWAWLCQDIWAAFRDKRRVFTFWKPVKTLKDLDPPQLAARSVFILGRVINYCVKENNNDELSATISSRLATAEVLSAMLNEWESLLTPEFRPLPHEGSSFSSVFESIWIYPPMFATAMQVHHASRLLILLHRPKLGGINETIQWQTSLTRHVDVICGIALVLSDYASSTMSSMCLFIAGLVTTDQGRREEITRLLEECRMRAGWPTFPLSDELKSSWQQQIST